MCYSIYKMNDMKNTKTDWVQIKRERARHAEHIADMKRRREINRKRDEEQARWDAQFNAPLDLKDRD